MAQPLRAVDIAAGGEEDGMNLALGQRLQNGAIPRRGLGSLARVQAIVEAQRNALGASESGKHPTGGKDPYDQQSQPHASVESG